MRNRSSFVLIVLFLMIFSGQGISQVSERQFLKLESPSAGIMTLSISELSKGIVSRNKVIVDVQALKDGSMIQPVSKANSQIEDLNGEDGFLMQLPDGSVVTLLTNRVQSWVIGVETYSGRVKEIESGYFTLSVESNKVYGQVNIDYMAYDIQYEKSSRSHMLTEIDKARMPKHAPEPLGDGTAYIETLKNFPTPLLSGSAIGTVRVLVLHGSDVSNPSTLASNIISSLNDTIFDDGMDPDLHFTLADLRNLGDDLDSVCKQIILYKMENGYSPFTNISTWIEDEDADVVLTIATTDVSLTGCSYNGSYGRVGGQASALLSSAKPFAVTMDTYAIGDLTAAHELGHVLGGGHPTWSVAVLESRSADAEPYSRGYIAGDGGWQTVMGAYDDNDCDFTVTLPNTDCVRLPLWSDPTKSYESETRGVTYTSDIQVPYSADMASALEIHMPIVAEWESYPYSAPGTPSNIDVEECFSQNIVTWDATTNAENYQVLYSAFSNFTNPEVIYFGSHEYVRVVVSQQSTKYIKIRACNGSGCGPYSSMLTLTYNGYCN